MFWWPFVSKKTYWRDTRIQQAEIDRLNELMRKKDDFIKRMAKKHAGVAEDYAIIRRGWDSAPIPQPEELVIS